MLYNPFTGLGLLANLLQYEAVRWLYGLFLYPMIALLILGVFGYTHSILRLLIWWLFVNLHYGNHEMGNAGWHVLHHALFFSIFFFQVSETDRSTWAQAKRLLHNLAHYGVWLLICTLYLVAGLHKLRGEMWLDGSALFVTLMNPEYSHPWVFKNLTTNNGFLMLCTWASLTYQLVFSIGIWIRAVRPWLLSFGMAFHLSIVFLLGITDFGLFLIAAYSIFIPEGTARSINDLIGRFLSLRRWRGSST